MVGIAYLTVAHLDGSLLFILKRAFLKDTPFSRRIVCYPLPFCFCRRDCFTSCNAWEMLRLACTVTCYLVTRADAEVGLRIWFVSTLSPEHPRMMPGPTLLYLRQRVCLDEAQKGAVLGVGQNLKLQCFPQPKLLTPFSTKLRSHSLTCWSLSVCPSSLFTDRGDSIVLWPFL